MLLLVVWQRGQRVWCVGWFIACRVFPRWSERRRRVPIEHRICSRAQLGEEGRPVGPPAAARAAAAPEGAVEHARAVTTIGGLLQPRASLSGVTVRIVHPSAPEGGCSNELGAPPLRRRALPKGHCPPAVARALCARARALARPLASRVECVRVCGGGGGCVGGAACARARTVAGGWAASGGEGPAAAGGWGGRVGRSCHWPRRATTAPPITGAS